MKRRRGVMVAVLATVVLAASCSSDSDNSQPPPTTGLDAGTPDGGTDQAPSVNPFFPTRLPQIADVLSAAYAGKATDPSTYKLGIVSMGLSAYWTALQLGASQATYKINCASSYVGASDAAEQVTAIRNLMNGGYKGVAVSVAADVSKDLDGDGVAETYHVEDAIAQAVAKPMGIITYDSDSVASSARFLYIGTDNTAAGTLAGQKMAELVVGLPAAKVAAFAVAYEVGGAPAANLQQRYTALQAVLAPLGVQVMLVTGPKDTYAATSAATLAANPDLTGVLTLQATTGPIVAQAVKDAGKGGVLKFVAFDFTPPIRTLIQEGVVHSAIVQEQYWMGYLAINILYSMAVLGNEPTRALLAPWLSGPAKDVLYTDLNAVTIQTYQLYVDYLQSLGIQG
jgi:ABC-type sugar transport system substrate-binding protein